MIDTSPRFFQQMLFSVCLSLLVLLISIPSFADPTPAAAPMNPDFLNFQSQNKVSGTHILQSSSLENTRGYIPSPVDYSYLENSVSGKSTSMPVEGATPLPAYYDLRDLGKVTSVKNQGSCGSCWSFASISSVESDLLFKINETWDFSENNLKNTHGFDWTPCYGGNADMSTAYFARWNGPVNEADDPYNATSGVSPGGLTVRKHLQEVLQFPPPNVSDLSSIKQGITQYGGLYATYYENSSNYNSSTHGYYYSGASSANHAITIVGWNDNFPSNSFNSAPPGNGAFIIKNSWGTSWGESGYFYISYYDSFILKDIHAFNDSETTSNYSRVYQYDPLGKTGSFGYNGVTSAWGANVFTAAASETITAVGFYAASPNTAYTVKVYTGVGASPTSGTLVSAATTSGTVTLPGYHTITLASPVSVTNAAKFSIVMLIDTPGYNSPLPIEYAVADYSSQASASAGQGYYAYNNSGYPGTWYDITTWNSTTNICIKAFAAPPQFIVTASAGSNGSLSSLTPSPKAVSQGGTTSFTFNANSNYHVSSVSGCGGTTYNNSLNSVTSYSYTTGYISSNCTVSAVFEINNFNIGSSVILGNGAIACDTPVNYGATAICIINPNFLLTSLTDNSVNMLASVVSNKYTLNNVVTDHFIVGKFDIAPNAPTGITAIAGGAQATVNFSAPQANGGSAVASYTVVSSPLGGIDINAGSTAVSHTVSNLQNGISYIFTVTASNNAGISGPSSPSGSVTPGSVRNSGFASLGYQTLQDAYNAGTHTSEIQILSGATVGTFVKGDSDTVTVKGGFDASFSTNSGAPAILGAVTLKNGTAIVENIIISSP